MSRCFPFPPPGYVRKAGAGSVDNVDLLKQIQLLLRVSDDNMKLYLLLNDANDFNILTDKHREKRDKREKKDREKREGKERKEKDRSDEKQRDKKEKKDKHRDKKKDKEKEKEKERDKEREKDHSSSSNDKKLPTQIGRINEEKTFNEKGPLLSRLPAGQTGEMSISKEKEREKQRNSTPDGKRPAGQTVDKIISTNNNSSRDIGDNNKYVQELEKRVGNDRNSGTQLAEKYMVAERKKDEGMVPFLAKPTAGVRPEGKERNKERRDNEQKVERVNGILKVRNFSGAVQSRILEVPTPLEQCVEKEIEWRDKLKGREDVDKRADKWKEKDGERKGQEKVKESSKERKEERSKEKSERNRHNEQEGLRSSRKNEMLSSPLTKNLQEPVKEPDKTVAASENVLKKRKDPETNGFLHANEIRSNKLQKQMLASRSLLENGRTLEPFASSQVAPPLPGPTNNSNNILEANKEKRKINGVTESRPTRPASSPLQNQQPTTQADLLLAEVPLVRPPHPDSKHLDEILSRVPRMEELPELDDDQSWLFHSNCEDSKKPKWGHRVDDVTSQVWGESLHIESADIYALPYVIPY
ncbi:RNA-binding protein 25-like isoform X1 [Punica granatum]|uniref:RNA-binding protein 25-like isoform X1 n=1 Tax=Punica granatum TaxID=22663 RepID=A0A6P8E361_PUNGR|nr:RNA-binding protein 25-like isoform X1 [Punica granatum]XP_031404377.1 RNA-binding protein 25-like isoform X1 [Punica granatum]